MKSFVINLQRRALLTLILALLCSTAHAWAPGMVCAAGGVTPPDEVVQFTINSTLYKGVCGGGFSIVINSPNQPTIRMYGAASGITIIDTNNAYLSGQAFFNGKPVYVQIVIDRYATKGRLSLTAFGSQGVAYSTGSAPLPLYSGGVSIRVPR